MSSALRTIPGVPNCFFLLVNSHIPKDHFATAMGTHKNVRPNSVIDLSFGEFFLINLNGAPLRMRRTVLSLVHPAVFLLDITQHALCFALKGLRVYGGVVIKSDESRSWRK